MSQVGELVNLSRMLKSYFLTWHCQWQWVDGLFYIASSLLVGWSVVLVQRSFFQGGWDERSGSKVCGSVSAACFWSFIEVGLGG